LLGSSFARFSGYAVPVILVLLVARGNNPPQPFVWSVLITLARGVVDLTKPTLRRE
jgi:hypothetical protein